MNRISAAIQAKLVDRAPLIDDNKTTRTALTRILMGASIAANGSYFPIIGQYSWILSGMDVTSFIIIDWWSVNAGLNDAIGPLTQAERDLYAQNELPKIYRIGLLVAACALAIFGRSSAALPPAVYYGGFLGAIIAIIIYLQGMNTSGRSLQLMFQDAMRARRLALTPYGKTIEGIRQTMLGRIGFLQKDLTARPFTQAPLFRRNQTSSQALEAHMIARIQPIRKENRNILERYGARIAGLWITFSLLTGRVFVSFTESMKLTGSPGLSGCLGAGSVLSVGYLVYKAVTATLQRLIYTFSDTVTGQAEFSIGENLRLPQALALKVGGATLNIGTTATGIVIFGAVTGGWYFGPTAAAAFYIFALTATLDLAEEHVEEKILKNGTEQEKQIIQVAKDLKDLKKIFAGASHLDFCLWLRKQNIPDVNKQELDNYIREKWPEQNHLLENV